MYKKITGIYCIENIINNKKYIGQSVNIKNRKRKHLDELNKNKHCNEFLQNDWIQYGNNSFKFEILEECDADDLDKLERYYINKYNTTDSRFGYNLTHGGVKNPSPIECVCNKISENLKDVYKNNKELINERRNSAYKQWADPSIKEKILGKNNGMYGKHHTIQAKEKMSNAATGRESKQKIKIKVLCVELNKIFDSASDAAKEFGTQSCCILGVCRGERHTANGYHWKFLE